MRRAGDILAAVFDKISVSGDDVSLFRNWADLVGEDVNEHVQLIKVEDSSLYIAVDHPGWAQIMKSRELEIIKKINKQYQATEIKRMRISVKRIDN